MSMYVYCVCACMHSVGAKHCPVSCTVCVMSTSVHYNLQVVVWEAQLMADPKNTKVQ